MSYKLGLIVSFPFLIFIVLFLADHGFVQIQRQQLDALSLTISYRIALEGRISSGIKSLAEENGARIVPKSEETPKIGDTVIYTLEKDYHPLIMASGSLTLRCTRTTVVGYYDI